MKEDSSGTAKIGYFFPHNSQVLLCLEGFSFLCLTKSSINYPCLEQVWVLGGGWSPGPPTPAEDWGMKSRNSALAVTDSAVPTMGVSS